MSLRHFFQERLDALPTTFQAAYWMLISAFGYSASIAIVHHLTARLPIFEIALARNVFGLMFMLPWLMKVGLGAMRTSHIGKHAVRGLLSAANVWFLFAALAYAPVADVSAITFMMPIGASVLAVLILTLELPHRSAGFVIGGGIALIACVLLARWVARCPSCGLDARYYPVEAAGSKLLRFRSINWFAPERCPHCNADLLENR